jgi:hypothetical protein
MARIGSKGGQYGARLVVAALFAASVRCTPEHAAPARPRAIGDGGGPPAAGSGAPATPLDVIDGAAGGGATAGVVAAPAATPADAATSANDASGGWIDVAATGSGWATWPMPNSPSSALANPQAYDTGVTGVATDTITGLIWQRDAQTLSTADGAAGIVDAANRYCAGLSLAGRTGWRVPTRIELVSILDFTRYPALNTTVFPTTSGAFLVSSTVIALSSTDTLVTAVWTGGGNNSAGGGVSPLSESSSTTIPWELQGPDAVRCVLGQSTLPDPHYRVRDSIVFDNWTKLAWTLPTSDVMLPSTLPAYCAGLAQAGGGWRAPSVNELETLYGDFPDGIRGDATAFSGTNFNELRLGSSGVFVDSSGVSNPPEWLYTVANAATGEQVDVTKDTPPTVYGPGVTAKSFWVTGMCVRSQ